MMRYLGLYAGGVGRDGGSGESSQNIPIPGTYLLSDACLNTLFEGRWINNAVIATFLYDICKKRPEFAFFSPSEVLGFMTTKRPYKGREPNRDWTGKVGVFCPLNVNVNHWVLYYVTSKTIYYYDPLGFDFFNENLEDYVKRVVEPKVREFLIPFCKYASYSVTNFKRDGTKEFEDIGKQTLSNFHNQQTDGVNCGAYVMRMIELITQTPSDQPLTDKKITSFEIPFFREATRSMLYTNYRDANSQPTYSPTSSVEEVSPPPGN